MKLRPIGPGRDPVARAEFKRDVSDYQTVNGLHVDGKVGTQHFWFMADTIENLKDNVVVLSTKLGTWQQRVARLREDLAARNEELKARHKLNYAAYVGWFVIGAFVGLGVAAAL